jgi:hypothetical protein
MPRPYIRLSAILTPLFIIISIGLILLGRTQSFHPALRGFVEGCEGLPQPCWYGIALGVTTRDEAREIIRSGTDEIRLNYESGYSWNILADRCTVELAQTMDSMTMTCPDDTLRVIDLMNIWGPPQNRFLTTCEKMVFLYHDDIAWGFYTPHSAQSSTFSYQDSVSEIFVMRNSFYDQRAWQGTQLFWNFRQLDYFASFPYGCPPPRGLDNPGG